MNVAELYAPPSTTTTSDPPGPILAPTPFTLRSLIDEAWDSYKAQWLPLAGVTLLYGAILFGFQALCEWLAGFLPAAKAAHLDDLASGLLSAFLAIGFARVVLAASRRQSFSLATLFSGGDVYLSSLGATFVTTFLVLCGAICLIVPGIVMSLALQLVPWLVADKRAGASESITLSQRLTRGHRAQLFALLLVGSLVTIGGLFACGVGLLAAYPLGQLMLAHAYRHLTGDARGVGGEEASPLTSGEG